MTDTFEGRPIQGDITRGKTAAEQWSGPRFLELLDAVLNAENVAAVRWRQYVPYFNDGEPCEFGVGEFYLKPGEPGDATPDPEDDADDDIFDDDEEGGDYEDGFLSSGNLIRSWDSEKGDYVPLPEIHAGAEPLRELNRYSGHFEAVLREKFGDHSIITATRDGFAVETYEHD